MRISVIICTHNPRQDYLERTLGGLRSQTLPTSQWELLLIDNASDHPLAANWDLSWHPNGRHIIESELGLTPARLRGIKEASGNLLIFVDDDNVLSNEYLTTAESLFAQRSDLGVASGRILPEYESPPPSWFGPYESWIAVRRIEKTFWSNFWDPRSEPCGAGMCVRRQVGLSYLDQVKNNEREKVLDRRGDSLLSGGDVAITKIAMQQGYAMGQFVELSLLHLIPTRRATEPYLFKLYRNLQASGHLMAWLDKQGSTPVKLPGLRYGFRALSRILRGGKLQCRLVYEEVCAIFLARKITTTSLQNKVKH